MISWHIKDQVIEKLNKHFGCDPYSPLFTISNVCLSCTHTHAATGGGQENVLYQLAHFGYIKELVDNVVHGISGSIIDAYNRMQPCRLETIKGHCNGISINRSPSAYEQNPYDEREMYNRNVDTEMFMLKIIALQRGTIREHPIGMINWLPVHPVCLNMSNQLVSGDIKGLASYYFERSMLDPSIRIPSSQLGNHFVAAFAQGGNEGDVTPNIIPAQCDEPDDPTRDGLTCNRNPHVCSSNFVCKGFGPGKDNWEWLETNSRTHYNVAKELFDSSNSVKLKPIETRPLLNYISVYWNMTRSVGCSPAFGYSVIAGTTDGPGPKFAGIWQGDLNPQVNIVTRIRDLILRKPTKAQMKCQYPKPIALDFEYLNSKSEEYRWMHDHLELQLFRIGSVFIYSSPVELSTMSGRRIIRKMKPILEEYYGNNIEIVITGLANQYAGYMTTWEEYQVQRYEGASTLWGPSSLDSLIMGYETMTHLLLQKESKKDMCEENENLVDDPGPRPASDVCLFKTRLTYQVRLIFPHSYDELPADSFFGKILNSASLKREYHPGDTVQVIFQGASPRNGFHNVPTFLTVECYKPSSREWITVYDDGDPCTRYWFAFEHILSSVSTVTITWFIDPGEQQGLYRIRYLGKYKTNDGQIHDINSATLSFSVS